MTRMHVRNLLAGVAVSAMLVGHPANATEFRLVLPASYEGDGEALGTAAWQVFVNNVGPGDTLSAFDGTRNQRIAKIEVPDDERYAAVKRKVRTFGPEAAKINAFAKAAASGGSPAPGQQDILSVLRGLGDNRIGKDEDVHVLLIGTPLQATDDPAWSMIGTDGEVQVPTDAAMLSQATRTPYSVSGRENALARSFIHVCTVGGPQLARLQDLTLRHVWGQWITAQGGVLATWAEDPSVCMERFGARVTQPLVLGEPNTALPPAMMRPAWNASATDGGDSGKKAQPDVFNVFFKAAHPRVRGLLVYTGVEYAPVNYPARYNNAWCYFNSAAGKDGVQVRVSVGEMTFGGKPVWHKADKRELEAAGISRGDFEAARSACRFPERQG